MKSIVTAIIIVLVIAGGVGAYLLMKGGGTTSSKSSMPKSFVNCSQVSDGTARLACLKSQK